MDIEKIDLTKPKLITPEEFYLNMIERMKALADYVNKPRYLVKTTINGQTFWSYTTEKPDSDSEPL